MTSSDAVVIVGGGFFGCCVALELKARGHKVLILEKHQQLMNRASLVNQARVHNGYHYPRSLLTALRSRVNFERFAKEFQSSICNDFDAYYAIAARHSNVTPTQFENFARRIGAPIELAGADVRGLFHKSQIAGVFRVVEHVFDADRLRTLITDRLSHSGVKVLLQHQSTEIRSAGGAYLLDGVSPAGEFTVRASAVFNCTYAQLNRVLNSSPFRSAPALPLKYELTEVVLMDPPQELDGLAITVMCGPFFSVMPFPARECFSFTHVRYTPHFAWTDSGRTRDPDKVLQGPVPRSHFPEMMRDAARYLPCMLRSRYRLSLWEVKTILLQSELDDSRPILYADHAGNGSFVSVMGGKIDNVYDVIEHLGGIDSTALRSEQLPA